MVPGGRCDGLFLTPCCGGGDGGGGGGVGGGGRDGVGVESGCGMVAIARYGHTMVLVPYQVVLNSTSGATTTVWSIEDHSTSYSHSLLWP